MKKTNVEIESKVLELYCSGEGPTEISKKVNIPRQTVKNIINRKGVTRSQKNAAKLSGIKKYNKPLKSNVIQNGYKAVKIDGKYYAEHRLVMENYLGRELLPSEIVHHIDNDKTNNNINNLFVCSSKEHAQIHAEYDKIIGEMIKNNLLFFDKESKKVVSNLNSPFKHIKIYLSGPMEYVPDNGVQWRNDVEESLLKIGFPKFNILNPCNKPTVKGGKPLSEEVNLCNQLKERGAWEEMTKIMKKIMNIDLRMVDKSDIVFLYLPKNTRMTGTVHEIVVAKQQKKPIITVVEGGIQNMSAWMMGLVGYERVYASIKDAIDALENIILNGPKSAKDFKEIVLFNFDERDTDE